MIGVFGEDVFGQASRFGAEDEAVVRSVNPIGVLPFDFGCEINEA